MRLKIAVVTAVYSATGVPLAQIRFAKALRRRGHDVELVFGSIAAGCAAPAVADVPVSVLGAVGVRRMLFPFVRYLKVAKPDIVFSGEDHTNGMVLSAAVIARSKAKISGSSRVSPYDSYSNVRFSKGWLRKLLMQSLFWRADALTCVSEDMVHQYRELFADPPHVCVYNIIADDESMRRMEEPVDHPWFADDGVPVIIAAGTLTERKAFADLVRAFHLVVTRGHDARLVILGEGILRLELEALAAELKISDRLWLPGIMQNPLKYFGKSQVIALTSLAEGLPNVLVEGMVCGCTPVATDCPTGPAELLRGKGVGSLVPVGDVAVIADGLIAAIERPATKPDLEAIVEPFREDVVIDRHFAVLGLTSYTRSGSSRDR